MTPIEAPTESTFKRMAPNHYAIVVFPGFQALDVFGPLDILNVLSFSEPTLKLSILAETLEAVPVKPVHLNHLNTQFNQTICPTHTYTDVITGAFDSDAIHVLLIPGGIGTREPIGSIDPTIDFLQHFLSGASIHYRRPEHIITVCTGAHVLARTGYLDGRYATTNKRQFANVKKQNPGVRWLQKARWVKDRDVWTSAGVSAGMDVMLAFLAKIYGEHKATDLAKAIEYRLDMGHISMVGDAVVDELDGFYDE